MSNLLCLKLILLIVKTEMATEQKEDKEEPNLPLVVFSLASPFHDNLKSEERLFSFFGKVITLSQQWREGGRGGTALGFGASVYNCSIVLAKYLESHPLEVFDVIFVLCYSMFVLFRLLLFIQSTTNATSSSSSFCLETANNFMIVYLVCVCAWC